MISFFANFKSVEQKETSPLGTHLPDKLQPIWNLAVFGTGAINGWDKVKITHWDNSITAL